MTDLNELLLDVREHLQSEQTKEMRGYCPETSSWNPETTPTSQLLTRLDALISAVPDIAELGRQKHVDQISASKEQYIRVTREDLLEMVKGCALLQAAVKEKEE